jgi:hypothetical protein
MDTSISLFFHAIPAEFGKCHDTIWSMKPEVFIMQLFVVELES